MIAFITHGSLIFFCFSLTYLTVTNLSWQPTKYHLAFYFWEIRSPWIFACSPRACPRSNFSTAPSPFLVPNCFTVTCLLPAYTALAMFHSLSPRLLYFCRRPPVARTRCWRRSSLPHSALHFLRYNSHRRSPSPVLKSIGVQKIKPSIMMCSPQFGGEVKKWGHEKQRTVKSWDWRTGKEVMLIKMIEQNKLPQFGRVLVSGRLNHQ